MSKAPSAPHFWDMLLFYCILMPGVGFFFMLAGGGEPFAFILTCMLALFSFPLPALAYGLWGWRMRRRWLATLISALAGILSLPLFQFIFYCYWRLVRGEADFSLSQGLYGTLIGIAFSALIHVITAVLYLVVRAVVHYFSRSADTQAS